MVTHLSKHFLPARCAEEESGIEWSEQEKGVERGRKRGRSGVECA